MSKIQLLLICVLIVNTASTANALSIIDIFRSVVSAVKSGLVRVFFTANVKRPIRVRTLEEVNNGSKNEFVVLDFIGLIEQYDGYTAEEYKVQTDDGYVLGLHRITGSPKSPKANSKPVVYIAHGVIGSSDHLVILGPQRSIAFELADAGYDVWLGNIRGNSHSRSHVRLSPEENEFWDFSMDESALYDTSKFIDFVLEKSGQEKLTYIGYSMGNLLGYMLLADRPEYNQKINLFVALAPAVLFIEPHFGLYSFIVQPLLVHSDRITGKRELLPQSGELASFAKDSCSTEKSNPCADLMSPFINIETLNITAIPTIAKYSPAGTSYNTAKHYSQQVLSKDGKLRKYNHDGLSHDEPEEYDLSRITVPNVLLYAKNDYFVKVEEAELLKSKLSNVTVFEAINDDKFNHWDFIWSTQAKNLVFDRVIDIMSKLL